MGAEFRVSTGQRVTDYVYKVENECIWLTISRHIKAQLFLIDTSCESNELSEFPKCCGAEKKKKNCFWSSFKCQ